MSLLRPSVIKQHKFWSSLRPSILKQHQLKAQNFLPLCTVTSKFAVIFRHHSIPGYAGNSAYPPGYADPYANAPLPDTGNPMYPGFPGGQYPPLPEHGQEEREQEIERKKKEKKKLEPLTVEDLLNIPIPKEPKKEPEKKKRDVRVEVKEEEKVRLRFVLLQVLPRKN